MDGNKIFSMAVENFHFLDSLNFFANEFEKHA
jgi:hypothetical protein